MAVVSGRVISSIRLINWIFILYTQTLDEKIGALRWFSENVIQKAG